MKTKKALASTRARKLDAQRRLRVILAALQDRPDLVEKWLQAGEARCSRKQADLSHT